MTIALGVSLNSSSSTLLPVKIWEINETRDLLHTWVWNDIVLYCNNGSDSYIFIFLMTPMNFLKVNIPIVLFTVAVNFWAAKIIRRQNDRH